MKFGLGFSFVLFLDTVVVRLSDVADVSIPDWI
jgi:hypothetical protein